MSLIGKFMKFIFLLALLTFSCISSKDTPSHKTENQPLPRVSLSEIDNDKEQAKLGVFQTDLYKEIKDRARLAGLRELQKEKFQSDDIEFRLWNSYGLIPVYGLRIQRLNGVWRAWKIFSVRTGEKIQTTPKELKPPLSGWNSFWDKLVEKNLPTLLGCKMYNDGGFTDAGYITFELILNKKYSITHADAPGLTPPDYPERACVDAKHMLELAEFTNKEFGLWQGNAWWKEIALSHVYGKVLDENPTNSRQDFNYFSVETGTDWRSFWYIIVEPKGNSDNGKTRLYKVSKDTGETRLVN
jgi:hypothetical protein